MDLAKVSLEKAGKGHWEVSQVGSQVKVWDGRDVKLFFDLGHLLVYASCISQSLSDEESQSRQRVYLKRRGHVSNMKEVGHGLR